jgi:hypothetical protein
MMWVVRAWAAGAEAQEGRADARCVLVLMMNQLCGFADATAPGCVLVWSAERLKLKMRQQLKGTIKKERAEEQKKAEQRAKVRAHHSSISHAK